jgi:hypothetical protein
VHVVSVFSERASSTTDTAAAARARTNLRLQQGFLLMVYSSMMIIWAVAFSLRVLAA